MEELAEASLAAAAATAPASMSVRELLAVELEALLVVALFSDVSEVGVLARHIAGRTLRGLTVLGHH